MPFDIVTTRYFVAPGIIFVTEWIKIPWDKVILIWHRSIVNVPELPQIYSYGSDGFPLVNKPPFIIFKKLDINLIKIQLFPEFLNAVLCTAKYVCITDSSLFFWFGNNYIEQFIPDSVKKIVVRVIRTALFLNKICTGSLTDQKRNEEVSL